MTTLRHRIADWISGGELTRLRADAEICRNESTQGWVSAIIRLSALQAIIACETPKANATVRRITKIAREALE